MVTLTQTVSEGKAEFDCSRQPKTSSYLSNRFLPRFSPRRWSELFDLGNLGRRQAHEQIIQIIKGVDPMSPATAQQCVNHRTTFASFGMPNEQPVAPVTATGAGPAFTLIELLVVIAIIFVPSMQ
jgi:hypothetical protein